MADDFFKENEEQPVEETTSETIKLGEKEYSQEELSQLVGLGEKYTELEKKYDTKLDRVVPEYSRVTSEAAELRKQKEEWEKAKETTKERSEDLTLTPEQREAAKKQLVDILGFEPMKREDYQTFRATEKLIDDAQSVISENAEAGNPKTSLEDLVKYMDDNGIRNPQKAYKLMFEEELDKIKEQKLSSIRPTNVPTIKSQTAGSKKPQDVKVTRDNSQDLLLEIFSRPKG